MLETPYPPSETASGLLDLLGFPRFDPSPIYCAEMVGHAKKVGMIPECVAKGSRFTFGGLGVKTCAPDAASMFAAVRNRPQTFATICGGPKRRQYGHTFSSFVVVSHIVIFQRQHA